jgi:hypothetical protein
MGPWEGRREGGLGRNKIKCKESVRGQLGQRLARSYSIVAQSSVYAIRHGRNNRNKKTSGHRVLCLALQQPGKWDMVTLGSFINSPVLWLCLDLQFLRIWILKIWWDPNRLIFAQFLVLVFARSLKTKKLLILSFC